MAGTRPRPMTPAGWVGESHGHVYLCLVLINASVVALPLAWRSYSYPYYLWLNFCNTLYMELPLKPTQNLQLFQM